MESRSPRWNKDWHTGAWASARAIWRPLSEEEEAQDHETWTGACEEEGHFLRVLWCEVRQFFRDLRSPARETAASEPESR